MRLRIAVVPIVLAAFVGCGKSSPAAVPRLPCLGGTVYSFRVTAQSISGSPSPAASALEAAQASLTAGKEKRAVFVAHEATGDRFSLLDANGTVTTEVIVADTGHGWDAVQYDSCTRS